MKWYIRGMGSGLIFNGDLAAAITRENSRNMFAEPRYGHAFASLEEAEATLTQMKPYYWVEVISEYDLILEQIE